MNKFTNLIGAIGVSACCAASANASVLNNWYFNPIGGGYAAAQQINEYLDINGNAFIDLTPTGGGNFTFTEFAVFNSVQADGDGQLFPINYPGGNITATFSAFGAGQFGSGFTFLGGTINLYQDTNNDYGTASATSIYGANNGNLIGSFLVQAGGGGLVDASGTPVANGQITVLAKAMPGALSPGYFFDPLGNDMTSTGTLAFAFTNANTIGAPKETMISEIICEGAGFTGLGCDGSGGKYSNAPGDYIFVSNNGQFKMAVPEPASLALIGLGLVGMGAVRRRRIQS